jgi:hypothetical protein
MDQPDLSHSCRRAEAARASRAADGHVSEKSQYQMKNFRLYSLYARGSLT